MSTEDPIASCLQAAIDAQHIAGAVALSLRAGHLRTACAGFLDVEAGIPMRRDALFRIASMTKPITSVAALMVHDEGAFALDDPITRWAPELADMRVLRTRGGALDDTVPAARPITFEDLLTHRAGLTYGPFHPGPLARAYADALGGDIDSWVAPDDWIANLASLPLVGQPGADFHYSHATDLLGLILARIEDAPLGDVLARRIFAPLGMKDTGFTVPATQAHRRAVMYGFGDDGRRCPRARGPGDSTLPERPPEMRFVSGGQGLWSTADDYLTFARLFVGDGAVDGVRLLKPETLARMTRNCLTPAQRQRADVAGLPMFVAGHGFGLGVATVMEPAKAAPTVCGGGPGAVGWPGGFGGWWQADPGDGSVSVFLTHNVVELDQLANGVGLGVFDAITRFQRIASGESDRSAAAVRSTPRDVMRVDVERGSSNAGA